MQYHYGTAGRFSTAQGIAKFSRSAIESTAYDLQARGLRRAFYHGMNIWSIVYTAQIAAIAIPVLVAVIACVRERGEDVRFAGSRIVFRS